MHRIRKAWAWFLSYWPFAHLYVLTVYSSLFLLCWLADPKWAGAVCLVQCALCVVAYTAKWKDPEARGKIIGPIVFWFVFGAILMLYDRPGWK